MNRAEDEAAVIKHLAMDGEGSTAESVRASERELRFTLKAGRFGAWTLDLATGELTTSEICRTNFGRDPQVPFTYEELRNAVHRDDQARMVAAVERSIATGEDYDIEYRIVTPGGEERWVQIRGQVLSESDGAPRKMAGVSIDTTERNRTQERLRESEARLSRALDAGELGAWELNLTTLAAWRSSRHDSVFGYDTLLPEWTYQMFLDHVIPEDRATVDARFQAAIATGGRWDFECRIRTAGGEQRWIWAQGLVERAADGRPSSMKGMMRDVTDRKRTEAALHELNETLEQRVEERSAALRLYQNIVQSDSAPMVAFDHELRVTAFNEAHSRYFMRVYGRQQIVGDVLPDLFLPEQAEIVRGYMTRALAGETFTVREELGDPAIEKIYWEISYNPLRDDEGRVIGAFHHAVDITSELRSQAELAQAQEALRQSQKMEAMGQLTGGVAHDFNNLLTPIIGALDLLQRNALGGARERRLIDGAAQSAERAKVLVQRLLAFARRQPLQPVAVNVAELVTGMADLVSSTTGPQVRVVVELDPELPSAIGDANQLEMALLNLSVNARDAMPDGGTLRISATKESVGSEQIFGLKPGGYVRLSIADTGKGMDESTLARAVEPFFSTKGIGKGTGLGLSMVHGLVSQLGGALRISSRLGVGTNVDLWLPQSPHAAEHDATVAQVPDLPQALGTALLVDDEELVRASTADMLSELGYVVIEAESAEEALQLVSKGLHPDVVMTDHLMPGLNGVDLARELRARWPELPVMIVSGYAEDEGLAPDLQRLTKPFRKNDLAASLAALFDQDP